MKRSIIVGALLGAALGAGGVEVEAKSMIFAPVKMMVQSGDKIILKGFRGDIEYVVSEAAKDITVEVKETLNDSEQKYQDDWQFSFKRDGSIIQVLVEGPTSKQVWNEILVSGVVPKFDIKLMGPSLPLDINWNEGKIAISQLRRDLRVAALKAEVLVRSIEGDVNITNQEGSVRVMDCKGETKVDSYMARVEAQNIEGKLDLVNFSGETRVQNITGSMNLNSYKGLTRIADSKGRLEFKNGNSPVHIEKFEGELRGVTAQGAVFADLRGEADVRLESAEGAVSLKLPASGAWVNLGTSDGALAVPSFLKLTRLPSQQIRTGRLHGSNGGSVFVRTTTGDIRIR